MKGRGDCIMNAEDLQSAVPDGNTTGNLVVVDEQHFIDRTGINNLNWPYFDKFELLGS